MNTNFAVHSQTAHGSDNVRGAGRRAIVSLKPETTLVDPTSAHSPITSMSGSVEEHTDSGIVVVCFGRKFTFGSHQIKDVRYAPQPQPQMAAAGAD